jgi:thiamine-phosphate pyrophosphorylase
MASPRLFLVAPDALGADRLVACATAACSAGDAASIVVPSSLERAAVAKLQSLGLAVLSLGAANAACDGIHLDAATAGIADARARVGKNGIVGAYCAASRHAAMQAAEDGADYIALSQNSYAPKEPIVGWWADLFEIPCVAFDPAQPRDLDILLPQKPDFIRPGDAMWASEEDARRVVSELSERILA